MMNRSDFLATSAIAAVAETVPGGTHFVERKGDFDEATFARVLGRAADVRMLFEQVAFKPQMFSNVKNALNGLQLGFGYTPARIAIAIAPHGPAAAFAYSDYLWQKYKIGEFFSLKDADGNPIVSNVFLASKAHDPSADPDDEKGMYQDTQIETLQKRGVVMLTCHTAVEEQARALVKKGFAVGTSAQEVANDILTHLISGAIVVPSMVATVAVLQQKYHYAYVALNF